MCIRDRITPKEYKELVLNNTITDVLQEYEIHPGDVFFLPAGRVHLSLIHISNTAQSISLNFAGLKKQEVLSNGRCIKLRSLDLDKDNTLERPFAITPQETAVSVEGQ